MSQSQILKSMAQAIAAQAARSSAIEAKLDALLAIKA
jgi:hypothetical protein